MKTCANCLAVSHDGKCDLGYPVTTDGCGRQIPKGLLIPRDCPRPTTIVKLMMAEDHSPSDLEKFIELYESFGVKLPVKVSANSELTVLIEADDKKITGHFGVVTVAVFNHDGKFIRQEMWG